MARNPCSCPNHFYVDMLLLSLGAKPSLQGLKDRGKEAPGAVFGDQHGDVAGLRGEHAWPVAVAVAEPVHTALMALRAEHGSDLQLDQLLQAVAHQLGDQLTGAAAIQ